MVEHQERAATRAITDSLDEQARLETLLEAEKPAWMPGSEGLHWLLRTPFRYPPLRHGSRFSSVTEPGVLYGSEARETAMTEAATYLWLFRAAPLSTGPLEVLSGGRTAVRFNVRSQRCAELCRPSARAWQDSLRDRGSWAATQQLGTVLRVASADEIRYPSARHRSGINGAVFDPQTVAGNRRPHEEHWQFRLDDERCWWGRGRTGSYEVSHAELSDASGRIPHPAL